MDLSQKADYIYDQAKYIGIDNVYFEPPASVMIKYPCLIYKRGTISTRYADNGVYKLNDAFDLKYIAREPDSEMVHKILIGDSTHTAPFKMIRHIRHYVADGLHHDDFKLYI